MFEILFVDDEQYILKSLERIFKGSGHSIHTASNGPAALAILERENIDLIITDYRMPGMDGIELLKIAKSIRPSAARIMLTGFSDLDVTISAINEGEIHKYITKPWENDALLALVNGILPDRKPGDSNDLEREIRDIREALKQSNFSTLRALSCAIELKDRYTKGHCERTMKLAEMLARAAGIDEERLVDLRNAALLHDIGKIGVSPDILNKNGRLTQEEMDIVKDHPRRGAFITSEIEFLHVATRIILEHHEKIDGSGYPHGKKGNDLLLESKILAIADVYDACTSKRSYRAAMDPNDALTVLENGKGILFDEKFVNLFADELQKPGNAALRTPGPAGD
jgi:putative two-component system response regulator